MYRFPASLLFFFFILVVEVVLFVLTLFSMDIFGAAHRWGGMGWAKRPLLPKICHTYPTMKKLGTVIPYLKKIRKIYESRDTTSEFC